MRLQTILESGPKFKTLESNTIDLTDQEREKAMKAGAVWNFNPDKPACAIKKAKIGSRIYYYCATHRCFQSASTLDKAIELYNDVVKPSA
jgi:hypothetical protein